MPFLIRRLSNGVSQNDAEKQAVTAGRVLASPLPDIASSLPLCPKTIDKGDCQRPWAMVSNPTTNPTARKWIAEHLLNFNTLIAAILNKQCFKFRYSVKWTNHHKNKEIIDF